MVVSLGKGSSAIPDVIKGSFPPAKKIYYHKEYNYHYCIWIIIYEKHFVEWVFSTIYHDVFCVLNNEINVKLFSIGVGMWFLISYSSFWICWGDILWL